MITERYYAYMMQLIDTNQTPQDIQQKYYDKVKYVRDKVKGKHPIIKVQELKDYLQNTTCTYSDIDIIKIQSLDQIEQIKQQYQNNYENYWTCDINALKKKLQALKQQYDIQFNTLTANMDQNTNFLVDEVLQFQDIITDRLCYKIQSTPENKNKSEMLSKYIKYHNLENCVNVVIGDGFNDMKAANDCKAIGIGVDGVQGGQYNVKSNQLLDIITILRKICEQK